MVSCSLAGAGLFGQRDQLFHDFLSVLNRLEKLVTSPAFFPIQRKFHDILGFFTIRTNLVKSTIEGRV